MNLIEADDLIFRSLQELLYLKTEEGHYAIHGFELPLSVTRLEGRVLFCLARCFNPTRILEVGTGTGYSTCWMALACPDSDIWTIDDFSEGGTGDKGEKACHNLWARAGIKNVSILREDFYTNLDRYSRFRPHMIFADGIMSRSIQEMSVLKPRIMALHDMTDGIALSDSSIRLATPSVLAVHAPVASDLELARNVSSIITKEYGA